MAALKKTLIGVAFGLAAGSLLTWAMVSFPAPVGASQMVSPLTAGIFTTVVAAAVGGAFGLAAGMHDGPN